MADSQERLQQLKAFDESKAGIKGIVDDGISKVPSIFIRIFDDPTDEDTPSSGKPTDPHRVSIPVVDLGDVARQPAKVIQDIRQAAESMGFFHVVNHGIPNRVLEEMLEGVRGFHELPREVKANYYSRDRKRKVKFYCSNNLSKASWRDSLFCNMAPEPLDPQELPEVCRDITMEFSDQVYKVGVTLFELLSQALGLKFDHLIGLGCAKERLITSHYYPPCPEPELTIGTVKHTDGTFITILLNDHLGGLQILVENKWIDVPHLPGALTVNIGDLLQIISNNKFIENHHNSIGEAPALSIGIAFPEDELMAS
ncbi:hypothetical protein M0R45_007459 [Rubus argutus]|uniref:Fe2OG dioxygenase domain-containing protein n=1 Tax=Rubus argutus TaxID=59490 RepID=A0AAW1XYB8_RUBAR